MPPRRSRRPNPASDERGAASLIAVAAVAVLVAVTSGLAQVESAVAARHRAQAGADLAVLAAAGQIASGVESACGKAELVAREMKTTMTDCVADGLEVVVHVEAEVGLGAWSFRAAHAAARGGPVLRP